MKSEEGRGDKEETYCVLGEITIFGPERVRMSVL